MLTIIQKILGVIFLFSGFVKGAEFNVTIMTVSSYMSSFGLEFSSWELILIGVLLIFIELTVGSSLLLNIHVKYANIVCLIICIVFLMLTYHVASNELLDDCGCFGSVWKVNAWDSFYKNIVMVVFSLIVLLGTFKRNKVVKHGELKIKIPLILMWVSLFSLHSLLTPAMLDTSPYYWGSNISEIKPSVPIFVIDEFPNINYSSNDIKNMENIGENNTEQIIILSRSPLLFGKNFLGDYLNSTKISDDKTVMYASTEMYGNYELSELETSIFGVDVSLYNTLFPSEFGVLRLKSGEIVGKADLNVFSIKFINLFNINFTYLMSKRAAFIRLLFWIISFIALSIWFCLKEKQWRTSQNHNKLSYENGSSS